MRKIPIFISEKHQMSFYYWCVARKEHGISDQFFVVTLDRHTDLDLLSPDERNKPQALDLENLVEVKRFVDTVLDDRNFILAAMDAGVIGNILIVTQESEGFNEYPGKDEETHKIFYHPYSVEPNFAKALFHRKNKELKKILTYHSQKNLSFSMDIDLDFFTYDCGDNVCVFSEEDFEDIFSPDSLIWWIYDKSKILTIAKETYWCGGSENSKRALKLLKKYFLSHILP